MGPSAEAKWAWIVLVPFYLPVNLHSRQLDYTLPLMRQALSHSRLPSRVLCSSQPFGFSSLAFESERLPKLLSGSSCLIGRVSSLESPYRLLLCLT
jgi:hypothetical protein